MRLIRITDLSETEFAIYERRQVADGVIKIPPWIAGSQADPAGRLDERIVLHADQTSRL